MKSILKCAGTFLAAFSFAVIIGSGIVGLLAVIHEFWFWVFDGSSYYYTLAAAVVTFAGVAVGIFAVFDEGP